MVEAVIQRGQFYTSLGERSHFSFAELMCPCCQRCEIDQELIDTAEALRSLVAEPVLVNSGYRCPRHNIEVGGAPQSRHTMGLAMDWRVHGINIYAAANRAVQCFPRVIVYPRRFIHSDGDLSMGQHWFRVAIGGEYLTTEKYLERHPGMSLEQLFGEFA